MDERIFYILQMGADRTYLVKDDFKVLLDGNYIIVNIRCIDASSWSGVFVADSIISRKILYESFDFSLES